MTAKETILNQIAALPKFGSGICLHRVSMVMARILPAGYLEQTPKIVVTGTDGKGSTSMLVRSILQANGKKTGLFTSPHFLEFNERFEINGVNADYQQLCQSILRVTDEIAIVEHELNETFGVFEVLFLVALDVFCRDESEVLIFEAGIGGRYDPVRLLKSKLTALTSVALEHTALLGDSKELIAYDKLDACYPGGKTITGNIEAGLVEKISAYSTLKDIEIIDSASEANLAGQTAKPQCYNIQTAIALCRTYFGNSLPENFVEKCQQGIEQCHIPGRFERISTGPDIFIDCAHTPDAFKLFFDTVVDKFSDKPMVFVVGISQGRDFGYLTQRVCALGGDIIVTQASFKGADAEVLFNEINQQNTVAQLHLETSLVKAVALAKQVARRIDGRIFVVGGLFLAGEVATIEKNLDIKHLYLY